MILDDNDPSAIATAARALRSGALLGLPTETVYGLAADASSEERAAFASAWQDRVRQLLLEHADDPALVRAERRT